jgi:hypothetical protein
VIEPQQISLIEPQQISLIEPQQISLRDIPVPDCRAESIIDGEQGCE